MKSCAFLTTDDLTGFVTDDELAVPPLRALGWKVDNVSWRADARWDDYDVVIVRSTWDYQDHPHAFDQALQRIDASQALLCNALPLMRWNMRKTYLRELACHGVTLAPTLWDVAPGASRVRAYFDELGAEDIVIKPVIGANADHAYRLRHDADNALLQEVAHVYRQRELMVQPFLQHVTDEGEYSLIFVGGELSHTILKTPKRGDFRVQEEHGGIITAVTPEPALLASATRAMAALPGQPFYARADFVRTANGAFAMMEVELIEPALYFRMDAHAPERFAAAVHRLV
jgi:glutathione synthase/RimK-type ligase-like ATP-grasp enzyme